MSVVPPTATKNFATPGLVVMGQETIAVIAF
jgi:hypothetical protein